jgi:methionyl-tRNA synthetase
MKSQAKKAKGEVVELLKNQNNWMQKFKPWNMEMNL